MNYRVICDQNSDQWLKERNNGVGASEIGVIAGLTPWGSALKTFAYKTGALVAEEDAEMPEHMALGNRFEPLLLEIAAEKIGRPVTKWQQLLAREDEPWARATPDGRVILDDGSEAPVEIKTAGTIGSKKWEEGVPIHYLAQLQWQMHVTGAKKGYIVALVSSPMFHVLWGGVDRDEKMIAELVAVGRDFWRRVQENDPPYPTGSEDDGVALKALYPVQGDETFVELEGSFLDMDEEYARLKADLAVMEKREKEIKQIIQGHIGDRKGAILPNGVVWTLARVEMPERVQTVKAHTQFRMTRKAPKA